MGTPSPGSVFVGWSGGGCSGTEPCAVIGNVPVTVTAVFDPVLTSSPPVRYALKVSKKGSGTVVSTPGGINCGLVCQAAYPSGSVVTLTAVPARDASFKGWTGEACTGTGPCTVTIGANRAVSATFAKSQAGASNPVSKERTP